MNTKAKGARRERQARDLLYAWGARAVIKAGASLGVFDLIALMPGEVVAVQVKSNKWPGQKETAEIRAFPNFNYLKKLIFRYDDRVREPQIRTVEG